MNGVPPSLFAVLGTFPMLSPDVFATFLIQLRSKHLLLTPISPKACQMASQSQGLPDAFPGASTDAFPGSPLIPAVSQMVSAQECYKKIFSFFGRLEHDFELCITNMHMLIKRFELTIINLHWFSIFMKGNIFVYIGFQHFQM